MVWVINANDLFSLVCLVAVEVRTVGNILCLQSLHLHLHSKLYNIQYSRLQLLARKMFKEKWCVCVSMNVDDIFHMGCTVAVDVRTIGNF